MIWNQCQEDLWRHGHDRVLMPSRAFYDLEPLTAAARELVEERLNALASIL